MIMPDAGRSERKQVLFLHPNFPAQFKHLANAAAAAGLETGFVCQTHYGRKLPGVKILTLKGKCGIDHLNEVAKNQLQRTSTLSDQYRHGLIKLKSAGWQPDVVISHSGWGCGLHVRELWPNCRHVAYVEWWFNPQSDFFLYDPENDELNLSSKQAPKTWLRNQAQALELVHADAIVAPTRWQAQQLPPLLKERCFVIHDGIDLDRFKPKPELRNKVSPLLTYGTRGMEPIRAFPQFIRSLPALLHQHQDVRVEIAGEDSINYGGNKPEQHPTWGCWAKEFLGKQGLEGRVSWLNYLNSSDYVAWLQRSSCHVYLTHPFVASWSLLEALACQCPMVVSDVKPVREICEATSAEVAYVDHRNIPSLSATIGRCLTGSHEMDPRVDRRIKIYSKEAALMEWSHVACLELTTNH